MSLLHDGCLSLHLSGTICGGFEIALFLIFLTHLVAIVPTPKPSSIWPSTNNKVPTLRRHKKEMRLTLRKEKEN